jgi:hypothetical protein
MSSLVGGKKKSAPAPKPVVEEKPAAPAGATRAEKMQASRIRARRTGSRALLSGNRLGPKVEGEGTQTTLGAG